MNVRRTRKMMKTTRKPVRILIIAEKCLILS